MELDDLKTTWRGLNRGPVLDPAYGAELLRTMRDDRVRRGLWRPLGWPLFDLAAGLVATFLLVGFIERIGWQLRFLLPALQLYLAAIAIIAASGWQIAHLRRLDYAAPAVVLQRALERQRVFRIRLTQVTLLLAPLLWVPFSIVTARALLGLDLYRAFGAAWLVANAALGLAVIPLGIWAARRFGPGLARSGFGRSLADDIAGRSLTAALADLEALARFEREE